MVKTISIKLISLFDLDALVILLIGVGNILNIDSTQVYNFLDNTESVVHLMDDFAKLCIAFLSLLILYKKYKKLN